MAVVEAVVDRPEVEAVVEAVVEQRCRTFRRRCQ
jgi:hypothetical protein